MDFWCPSVGQRDWRVGKSGAESVQAQVFVGGGRFEGEELALMVW